MYLRRTIRTDEAIANWIRRNVALATFRVVLAEEMGAGRSKVDEIAITEEEIDAYLRENKVVIKGHVTRTRFRANTGTLPHFRRRRSNEDIGIDACASGEKLAKV